MAIKKVFRDVALEMATKQRQLVDAFTEESPILQLMPMQESSHGWHNVYEKINSIQAAQIVDLDDELPEVDMDSTLEQTDLGVIGGTMYVGYDKARKFNGPSNYFNRKMPSILRETASQTETSIIYNNLRQFAIDNGNVIDVGGSENTNFSIIVVKWVEGETTGLYDPNGPGDGKFIETIPLSGGNLFKKNFTFADSSQKDISVYGADFKTYLGIQLANERYVSAAVNIDIDGGTTAEISEAQMNELVYRARATPGNSFIYMHPRLLTNLFQYKSANLQTEVTTTDLNFTFQAWNGIPIIPSYNFDDGTEANV